jgi:O-acetyl-ADP-ribose deacetylase (regulator of RNase III)/uncharacterized protein YwgA
MLKVIVGDIFESKMSVLVNTVNCVGVMGKGIAKTYKNKYPQMFNEYKCQCLNKEIHTGQLYPYYEDGKVKILNFPTKDHWRSPSKIEYIITGLDWFIDHYKALDITSIAFPPLGCGNGGLDWDIVGPIMYQKLKNLSIDIEIYAPFGIEKKKIQKDFLNQTNYLIKNTGITYQKVNDKWLLVLQLIKHLEMSEYNIKVGRTVFQKICYVLNRYGTDLNLKFVKGVYGPYSHDIKEMITILSNNNLICEKEYGKMMLITVTDQFKINPSLYNKKDIENVNQTFKLFKRIKDTTQAELVTTILFSYDQLLDENKTVSENMIYEYVIDWKKRYNNVKSEMRIREIIKSLAAMELMEVDYSRDFVNDIIF